MVGKMLSMAKRNEEKTATIRVTESIAKMIEVICTAEGITASKVVTPMLEKQVRVRYLKALETLNRGPKEYGIKDD